jgi:two-component system LytT family response regulator
MTPYSVIIVDDEKPQQKLLSDMLADFPDYKIITICNNVEEAVLQIRSHKPDLIFLDVVMPPKTGFDVVNALKDYKFNYIFTTSFEEFAIRAFKVSAVDYLLKPFGTEDLSAALLKFEEKKKLLDSNENIQTLLHNLSSNSLSKNKIGLPGVNGFNFVNVGDIIRCQADDMYTTFFMTNGSKILVSKNIKECEQLLEAYGFFRVHITHLINLEHVVQYFKGEGGQVKMADDSLVDVSRRKKDDFLRIFKKI